MNNLKNTNPVKKKINEASQEALFYSMAIGGAVLVLGTAYFIYAVTLSPVAFIRIFWIIGPIRYMVFLLIVSALTIPVAYFFLKIICLIKLGNVPKD